MTLIYFKLDFSKANNKVSWEFLFLTMKKLGIMKEFVEMVKLLFQDAKHIYTSMVTL
jgi:hypothetical protein